MTTMKRLLSLVGFLVAVGTQGGAQNGGWIELGPWELVERLDNVQVSYVLNPDMFSPKVLIPKLTWLPGSGGSEFFPASGTCMELLYYRWATAGQYYAYESDYIVLDDVLIDPMLDPSNQGRFRICRVEIMVYFPRRGTYQLQGFWTGAEDEFPPMPTQDPPGTFAGANRGPHTVNVPAAGVWRLATLPTKELFTVQAGRLTDPISAFAFYIGLKISRPGAWVCGDLPGDPNFDYFLQYEPNTEERYRAYRLEQNVPATFGVRIYGTAAPGAELQGTITVDGYTGSYAGRQATIKIKQGTQVSTYTVPLNADGSYLLRPNETGDAEVWVKVAPGLAKKVSLNLTGTVNQNFTLTNGDVNDDNVVNNADLLSVLFDFGSSGSSAADVNGDGTVNNADLLIVLFNFGRSGDEL
ncbi:MAG: dockerin type I domain-containing protein [Armatimonadota bacterium]|nr:dockerin type I domain-containing protein [Armatimonadota bacterium]